ncbi:ubiquitin-associated protein 2 isoform X2 [Parasteatoda tepidariorum]|uniref:ubiquitin-associated protein 2 isoform X2 n=1 Tax=Parasteatoda tepidariorum TaxID=114398 RepID=UPI00077FD535|nr:protein lingerer isoform X2 [Parasteatoda tepidariorum]
MSSTTSQRAGRSSKDRPKQPSHSTTKNSTEGQKTGDNAVPKIQPTAEQMRIAQIIYDGNKADYPDLKDKVERIIEITGRTKDDALVALHDCDNDSNRATIMLLEGNEDEGKWETSGKKKKNRQTQQKAPEVNGHEPAPVEKEEKEPVVENTNRRREPKQRGEGSYRYRGPPRMNRGGNQNRNWRNKENEKNERNLQEGRRERNNEGRSRGPRKNFSGRGRGRGGRSRTFQNRGLQNNDGFPESIDTWNNSTAEKVNMTNAADSTMTVGNWSDVAVTEEWSEEDWAENLTETKVFTPSAGTQSTAVAGLDIPTATALGQNIDLASFLQKSASSSEQNSSMPATNGPSVGPASLLSQQIPQMQQAVAPQSQSHFDFNQFAKQAEAQIKAAVGVVSQNTPAAPSINSSSFQSNSPNYPSSYSVNNTSSQHHVQLPPELQQVIVSQSNYSSTSSSGVHISRDLHSPVASQQSMSTTKTTTSQHQTSPLPQRVKPPPKARLPPPSKIPESAVVMPDDAVTSLDVQFGALQFGTDSSPFDFTSGETSSAYQDLGQSSSVSSHVNSQTLPSSITSSAYSNALPSSVTMSKESTYNIGSHSSPSQNSISNELGQSQKVANQESILLSQSEHKSVENVSSFVNHRSNQGSNLESTMMSNKSDQSALNFNTSTHDSAYSSYSNQKSVLNSSNLVPSTVSYTHTSSSMNSGSSDISSNQPSQPKYQGQSQNSSYVSGSSSAYGLQPTPYSTPVTTTASSYSSQTGYSSHSSSYGTNNSSYNSQQSVYSGAVTTAAQSGSMISTSVSNSKLSNSLNHSVKESSLLESQHNSSQHSYEVPSTTTSSSVLSVSSLAQTSATNHSVQNSSNMNSVLGLVSTSSSTTTTSVLKNSLSASKAVPNIPQNMPAAMLGHQYVMGQASLPFYGLQQPIYSYEDVQVLQSKLSSMGLQSPVYSYEDMQMLQSKLSTLGYYDMQFQAPTSMTGRDPGMTSVAYTADGKYSRAETDASTVATTLSQGQASTQAHGQAFLNPAAALPPGYGYYFAGGMMGGIHHYAAPPIFPVPPATNTHGATTNSQFQKANAYGSHSYSSGYESLSQQQDYSKGTYGAASQNQVKGVSGSGAVPDLSGSVYSKAHAAQLAKSYDKPGFHTGTPPPFNLAGSQAAGPLGASSGPYATQFIPVLAHGQHHSTALLHHHMQQDTTQAGGTPAAGQRGPQGLGQQKNSNKQNYAYWTSN